MEPYSEDFSPRYTPLYLLEGTNWRQRTILSEQSKIPRNNTQSSVDPRVILCTRIVPPYYSYLIITETYRRCKRVHEHPKQSSRMSCIISLRSKFRSTSSAGPLRKPDVHISPLLISPTSMSNSSPWKDYHYFSSILMKMVRGPSF